MINKKTISFIFLLVCLNTQVYAQSATQENSEKPQEVADAQEQEKLINDPLEPINRKVYSFNKGVDKVLLKPASKAYDAVTPNIVQRGVSNFFNYLKGPWNVVNYALQGNKEEAGNAMGRFLVNTFGLGVFDIASEANIPLHNTSFGDTLGVWGVPDGPYVVLPILGGNTLRDSSANIALDIPLAPQNKLNVPERNSLNGVDILQTRTDLDKAISVVEDIAIDEYSFVRDGQIQRRKNKIEKLKSKEE